MTGLLAASKVVIYVIVGIVGLIVTCVIMHFINREFRIRYDLNLIGGGLLMLLAGAGYGIGIWQLSKGSKVIGFVLIAVGLLLTIITLVYDCKKCGGMGIIALFCQLLFSVPALFLILELFTGNYTTMSRDYRREERDIRRARERRGYDNYDNRRW